MALEYHINVAIFFSRKFVRLVSLKVPSGGSLRLTLYCVGAGWNFSFEL